MLIEEIVRTVMNRIATEAMAPGDPKRVRPSRKVCGHRPDEIDRVVADESENRAGAENEHERDDRRGDENAAPDVAGRGAAFAGENGDVFESAQARRRQVCS